MKREYLSGAGDSAPSVPDSPSEGYPRTGDVNNDIDGTVLGAYWFHMVTEAILTVIEEAGLTPSDESTQFRDAVRALLADKASLSGATFAGFAQYGESLELPASDDTKKLATTEWTKDRIAAIDSVAQSPTGDVA